MAVVRHLVPTLALLFLAAIPASAQDIGIGIVSGRVVDSTTQQPLSNVNVIVDGTPFRTLTRNDGSFTLSGVPAGTQSVRARRIGYSSRVQQVTITSGQAVTAEFMLMPQAATLGEVVVTGYGTQRREAITGSVSSIEAVNANVGVLTNATTMMQGRVAGLQITQNNGEPGAGSQIRVRGGTSLSGGNDPLYVIDGVPIANVDAEPQGIGIGGSPPLARNPLNLLNPSDIESITILKDASASAIYGARAANGVILIETKKGTVGGTAMEYDTYIASSSPSRYLDVLNGDEYRAFVQQQVAAGELPASRALNCTGVQTTGCLGPANTNWERSVTRSAVTHNHNVSFTGGSRETQYRASLNYMDQEGVALANGLERYQGRLNATHNAFEGKMRLGLNLTASHVKNDYLPFENTGGFEGGVFQNMVVYNPTQPVTVTNAATGLTQYFEIGTGSQSVRNPVALAEQIDDVANTSRTLGNVTAAYDVMSGLTAQVILGVDRVESLRRIYFPAASPVGAVTGGQARQSSRDNQSLTLQNLLTYTPSLPTDHQLEVIGGYEFNKKDLEQFTAETQGFLTDAFGFNNLAGGATIIRPSSYSEEARLVSFFSRANYGLRDKYYLTGVLRRDGSSRFGAGNKWAVFPAVSASWRVSSEDFMRGRRISDLRLRAGWGRQGNEAVPSYSSLVLLETSGGARYPFGDVPVTGVAPVRNANPDLKWEQTEQINFAVDFGLFADRYRGTIEYYVKDTKDLLQEVSVPQPAAVSTRLENIGKIQNKGVEVSLDGVVYNTRRLNWNAGIVFEANRNKVVSLGPRSFITTAGVSGQGQSGQVAQRIIPGQPLGTFYGPVFLGVDAAGKQVFRCVTASATCVGGETTNGLAPPADAYQIIGDANPSYTLGLNNRLDWGRFDASFLIRTEQGRDVFNNTALVYATKSNALQDKNFLKSALTDNTDINEPAIYSSRWIEDGSFVRLQNITIGYTLPRSIGQARNARLYVSGDNLLLLTGYDGYDPEVHADAGLASRGIDYLAYPRPRIFTAGIRLGF